MRLFGQRKPLHERLLEAGGLAADSTTPPVPAPRRVPEVGIHGIAREREWDAVATVEVADLPGRELAFDVLPDRTLLVEGETEQPLTPLADAVERDLKPPYRAWAVRQSDDLWAVAARAIDVVRLQGRDGESLELTVSGGERELVVDGLREFGGIPEIEALASSRYGEYVVRGERLDDDWWEVRVDPL